MYKRNSYLDVITDVEKLSIVKYYNEYKVSVKSGIPL